VGETHVIDVRLAEGRRRPGAIKERP